MCDLIEDVNYQVIIKSRYFYLDLGNYKQLQEVKISYDHYTIEGETRK